MDQLRLTTLSPVTITSYATIDSTNTAAKRLIGNTQLKTPVAIVADEQTAGYGRHGRQYFSPDQVGVYLTLIWPVADSRTLNPGQVTTSVAVAAATALSVELGVQVGIKWVNDLYYQHKKVAGILVESVGNHLIIGIGLNINPTDYPVDIQAKAGALTDQQVDREHLVASLLNYFVRYFSLDARDVMRDYRKLSLVIGQQVELVVGKQIIQGRVQDVLDDGGLFVQTDTGQQTFYSGEITKLNMTGWTIS